MQLITVATHGLESQGQEGPNAARKPLTNW